MPICYFTLEYTHTLFYHPKAFLHMENNYDNKLKKLHLSMHNVFDNYV